MASLANGLQNEGHPDLAPAAMSPASFDLRLIVSGLRTGITLSLWHERLQDQSRGRVFRPIRARKHHKSEKKARRDRKRGRLSTPKPPTPYKMKDFYLPGYHPPDFPGAIGTTPPRDTDPLAADDDKLSEGSPEHNESVWHMTKGPHSPRESVETQFRSSRDRTKKFMDSYVAEARSVWDRASHSLQEAYGENDEDDEHLATETTFLSNNLETTLERGFKALDVVLQGQSLKSLDDVCLLIFIALTMASVSQDYRLIDDYHVPCDSDIKLWRECVDQREWAHFDDIIKYMFGRSTSSLRTGNQPVQAVQQRPSQETLETSLIFTISTQHLGEAFLCLSSRNDTKPVTTVTAMSPVNSAYQNFLNSSRREFGETIRKAISEDFSGKLHFLEALAKPAVELLSFGALPTLRAFETYVLGLARIYIAEFADYKSFVRSFLKFCEGCSTKVSEIFVNVPNEEPYSRQYCSQKTDSEILWYRVNLGKVTHGSTVFSNSNPAIFDLNLDAEDISRPKYSSQFKRDYADLGNLLALPELLWSENGNIKVEVDEEDDTEDEPATKPSSSATESTEPSLPPPQDFVAQPFDTHEEIAPEQLDDDVCEPKLIIGPNLIEPDPSIIGKSSNDEENVPVAPVVPPVPNDVEPKQSAKRKSWRTDSIVPDLGAKKRKGLQTTCEICGISLSLNPAGTSKSNLIRHAATHAKSAQFTCTVPGCNKAFGRKDNLTRHMRKVHES